MTLDSLLRLKESEMFTYWTSAVWSRSKKEEKKQQQTFNTFNMTHYSSVSLLYFIQIRLNTNTHSHSGLILHTYKITHTHTLSYLWLNVLLILNQTARMIHIRLDIRLDIRWIILNVIMRYEDSSQLILNTLTHSVKGMISFLGI